MQQENQLKRKINLKSTIPGPDRRADRTRAGNNKQSKILIIDDDKDLCDSLMDILESEGYLAEAAYTADEGIKKLRSDVYNVVLLDLRLPDSEGTELLERIKVLARYTEVIIFTAYASIDSAVEALGKGAFSFVQKPYEVPHLISVIEKAHGNQKILIEKTKLFARLETLNRISQTVAQSLDIGKILTGILREIFAVTGFNMGKICEFFDDKHSNLESEGLPHKLIEGLDGRSPEDTLCGEVIKSNKPVIIEKNLPDSPFVPATDAQFLINEGFESYVGIPIRLKQRPIAVLSLLDKKPRKLSPDILELLITICNQVGSSIVNSRLFQKVSDGKRDWETTFDSISDLISIHDEDFSLIRCNKALAHKFNLKPEDLIGKKCREIFYGSNEPFSNCPLIRSKQTLKPETEEIENLHMGGVFQISTFPRFDEQGKFNGCVHVARDITESKQYEERIKEASEINEILLSVSNITSTAKNRQELIVKTLETIYQYLYDAYCAIIIWDKDTRSFNTAGASGKEDSIVNILRTIRFKKPYLPLIERIIESKQSSTADIDDIDAKTGEFMREIRAGSMLIAPLVSVGRLTGFVMYYYADSGKMHSISHKEFLVVEGLAGQLSIGMENARLYEELMFKTTTLENNLEVISVMRELDRTILSTLEPAQIFEVSAQLVDRIIPCDRVTVVLIDRERGGFIYKAGWGIEFEKGAFVKFEDTNATEVVRTKRPIVRLNIAGEKNLLPLDKSFLEQGFLSDIRVPLIIKGEVYGLLNVGSRRRAGFTQEHISAAADIGTQVSVALSNATLVTELKDLYFNTVKSLSEAIDAKSEWTRGHSDRVTDIAMSTGEELGLEKEDMENLRFAAMLHDIGKIGTYEYILDKKEPLTEAEQKVIKDHPVRGAEIIGDIKQFKDVTPGVRHHHERYDGGGYPDGLSGKEIPLFARIINVADSFDAMTADRPYRKGLSREKGIEEVKKNSGIQFDPEIVAAFLRKIERVQTPC